MPDTIVMLSDSEASILKANRYYIDPSLRPPVVGLVQDDNGCSS
jgi:hypothetical protein